MTVRLESTSAGPMGSGFLPLQEGSQPPAPPVVAHRAHLPERYGIPLFELLIVDPFFIFISWELTPAQIAEAESIFGNEFPARRLRVLLIDNETGAELSARELYGDVGRWFIQLNEPGIWLRAELCFIGGSQFMLLNSAGPVFVPRDSPVEPEHWEELSVNYSRSEKGELRIDSSQKETPGWPKISLESHPWPVDRADSAGQPGYFSATKRVDPGLLRPLLPLAPASVEEIDD